MRRLLSTVKRDLRWAFREKACIEEMCAGATVERHSSLYSISLKNGARYTGIIGQWWNSITKEGIENRNVEAAFDRLAKNHNRLEIERRKCDLAEPVEIENPATVPESHRLVAG